tara:strand:+ start:923 stop:1177 length:255 start_codon:yes stop_codon:yes gene_type:complete
MIGYQATYTKKDGSSREIRFVRTSEMPADWLEEHVKGTGKKRTLKEGNELVWDIDNAGFRIFNWGTVQGDVKKFEFSLDTSTKA